LIPINPGLSELHWFRSGEGEFRYPANIPNCLIGKRKDKVAGRRTAHIVVELTSRAMRLMRSLLWMARPRPGNRTSRVYPATGRDGLFPTTLIVEGAAEEG